MSDSGGNFQPGKSQNDGTLSVNSKEKESEKEGREGRREERKGERREGQGIRWVPSILYLNALHFNPLPTRAMAGTYSVSLSPWADLALVLCSATGSSLPPSLHPQLCPAWHRPQPSDAEQALVLAITIRAASPARLG